jgi:hypothetical protein
MQMRGDGGHDEGDDAVRRLATHVACYNIYYLDHFPSAKLIWSSTTMKRIHKQTKGPLRSEASVSSAQRVLHAPMSEVLHDFMHLMNF